MPWFPNCDFISHCRRIQRRVVFWYRLGVAYRFSLFISIFVYWEMLRRLVSLSFIAIKLPPSLPSEYSLTLTRRPFTNIFFVSVIYEISCYLYIIFICIIFKPSRTYWLYIQLKWETVITIREPVYLFPLNHKKNNFHSMLQENIYKALYTTT